MDVSSDTMDIDADAENRAAAESGAGVDAVIGGAGVAAPTRMRALVWGVDVQQATTRPASCRSCGLVFSQGELKLVNWGSRKCARWTCAPCLAGRLPTNAEFRPMGQTQQDSLDAAKLATCPEASQADTSAPQTDATPLATGPPQHADWDANQLPGKQWWAGLAWANVFKQGGGTPFVQVPDRYRGAMLEVRHKSLEVLMEARTTGGASEEWKSFC